jgi:hypothetical protein
MRACSLMAGIHFPNLASDFSIFGTDFLEQPFSQHYNVYWAKTSERIFANDRARQEQFLININLSIINSYQFEARGCELTGAL